MKAIVVGSGGAARALLRRLGDIWEVVVIDIDAERLALAEKVRPVVTLQGDGSSRVVLERAGIADADALVAATYDDDVNLEVCSLARDYGLLRVAAAAASPDRLPDYRAIQVPAFSPASLAARQLELSLEPRRVSSTAFAHGRAEAIEFEIAPDSPVRGQSLRDLASQSWLVAAILRDDRLIVPHGNTILETGDLVTVVGAAADFPLLVRTFTAGEARFPLDWGKRVTVVLTGRSDLDGPIAEAISLTRNSQATSLLLVHRKLDTIRDDREAAEIESMLEEIEARAEGVEVRMRPVAGPPMKALPGVVADESAGVVVLPAPGGGMLRRVRSVSALRMVQSLGRPVLFSRGTHPYEQIVAPARDSAPGWAAARAAIDLASYGKAELTGVAAVPPVFIAGTDGRDAALRSLIRLREEAAVQGVQVRRRLRQGNPVRILQESADRGDLVVVGMPERRAGLLRPGIVGLLLSRTPASVLVVPVQT
ncbi:MAG TPA: NAD-binding protein [Acidimicrobiia bacterium]|nr:NAD-binding protein [Acidimicrobiia bacterium]